MALSAKEILNQSNTTLEQWLPLWESQARENAETIKRSGTSHKDLVMRGTGKTLICVAMGASLEKHMDTINKHSRTPGVEIACVDKAFPLLMQHGVTPDYVFIADGKVSYEAYCEPWVDKTENTALVSNATANPKWGANWKGKTYWYVNKDNIQSEITLADISGCHECIPASSNVGNTVVVFALQVLNYDRLLLVGYDFCWEATGNYYAYDWCADKRAYMRHMDIVAQDGRIVQSSTNLQFSARWLVDFVKGTGAHHVRDCSGGILMWETSNLEQHMDLVAKMGQRKWFDNEKQDFIQLHRQEVTLGINQFEQIPKLLNQPGMATLNVTLSGVPSGAVQFAESQ